MMSQSHPQIALTQTHMNKQQKRLDQLNELHSSGVGLQSAISNSAHPANPLVPQEQVLNKYAAMVSVSMVTGHCHMILTRCQHQQTKGKVFILTVMQCCVIVVGRKLSSALIGHLKRN